MTPELMFERLKDCGSIAECQSILAKAPDTEWDEAAFYAAHPRLERDLAREHARRGTPAADVVRMARWRILTTTPEVWATVVELRAGGIRLTIAPDGELLAPESLEPSV